MSLVKEEAGEIFINHVNFSQEAKEQVRKRQVKHLPVSALNSDICCVGGENQLVKC